MAMTPEFMAGLITGEGSFCLGVQHRKGGVVRITPIFALFMSDRETVEELAESLRWHNLPVYVAERPKAGNGQIGVHISGFKRVKRYCEFFADRLTGQKFEAANLVYDFILDREKSQAAQGRTVPYSDHQKDIVRRLRLVNGNTRGRKNPL